jgi:uncharacterized protein (UPF0147 family)
VLTAIETITDYQKLPTTIRHIIEGGKGKVTKAEKSYALQNAVALAVRDQDISYDLAVQILKANYAYGNRGKEVLKGLE